MKKLPDTEYEVMKAVWDNTPPVTTTMIMEMRVDVKISLLSFPASVKNRIIYLLQLRQMMMVLSMFQRSTEKMLH